MLCIEQEDIWDGNVSVVSHIWYSALLQPFDCHRVKAKFVSMATKTAPNLLSPGGSILTASLRKRLCEEDFSSNIPGYPLIYSLIQERSARVVFIKQKTHLFPSESDGKPREV